MNGQTQIPGVLVFDVDGLEISATGGIWTPSNIVATNEPFDLGASFHGSGFVWQWLKTWAMQYKVSYFAEGIGASAKEVDLGSSPPKSLTASNNYTFADTKITVPADTLTEGVYRIACLVTFPGAPGLTGFFESLVIEVYKV
jgi:hypothetical protein